MTEVLLDRVVWDNYRLPNRFLWSSAPMPSHRRWCWGPERLSNLLKVTQLSPHLGDRSLVYVGPECSLPLWAMPSLLLRLLFLNSRGHQINHPCNRCIGQDAQCLYHLHLSVDLTTFYRLCRTLILPREKWVDKGETPTAKTAASTFTNPLLQGLICGLFINMVLLSFLASSD